MAKSKRTRQIERMDRLVREIILIRDNHTCQKCHTYVQGQNAHTSHIAPKGRYINMRFNLINVLLFCYRCHLIWWHRAILEASKWFQDNYPARYKYIEETKDDTIGYKESQLDEIEVALKAKLKELKSNAE